MTWEQLQQLRETARAEIARRVSLMQPNGGAGVSVFGQHIAVNAKPAEESADDGLTYAIWQGVETEIRSTSDGETVVSHVSFPMTLALTLRAGRIFEQTFAHEDTQIVSSSELERIATITLESRPNYFPLRLRLEQRDEAGTVYDTSSILLAGRTRFRVTAAVPDVFLYVHVAGVSLG